MHSQRWNGLTEAHTVKETFLKKMYSIFMVINSARVWTGYMTVNLTLAVSTQYLGAWYELYRIPNAAENDLTCEVQQLFKTDDGIGIESVAYNTRWGTTEHFSTFRHKFILISTSCNLQRTVICCM
jgi:hypothetical protein